MATLGLPSEPRRRKSSASYNPQLSEKNVILTFSLRDLTSQSHVSYKADGERFTTSTNTIKLACNTKYKVEVATKPEQHFLEMEINGVPYMLEERSSDPGTFTTDWSTPFEPDKRGTRSTIRVTLRGPSGVFFASWQCKFYDSRDQHSHWGDKLHAINYICSVSEDGRLIPTEEEFKGDLKSVRKASGSNVLSA